MGGGDGEALHHRGLKGSSLRPPPFIPVLATRCEVLFSKEWLLM